MHHKLFKTKQQQNLCPCHLSKQTSRIQFPKHTACLARRTGRLYTPITAPVVKLSDCVLKSQHRVSLSERKLYLSLLFPVNQLGGGESQRMTNNGRFLSSVWAEPCVKNYKLESQPLLVGQEGRGGRSSHGCLGLGARDREEPALVAFFFKASDPWPCDHSLRTGLASLSRTRLTFLLP